LTGSETLRHFSPLLARESETGLPDFSRSKHTKKGTIYQRTTNYTKRPYIVPNGHKIYLMGIKYTNITIPRPSKIYPIWNFWS
jgi:hypothetical protein